MVHVYFRRRGGLCILARRLILLGSLLLETIPVDFAWVQALSNSSCDIVGPILVLLVQVAHESLLS